MKDENMDAMPAVVLTHMQLKELLVSAGREAAEQVITELRAELVQDPRQKNLLHLREYLADPSSIPNPREYWADSWTIRSIYPNSKGEPKSVSWFMKFQRNTGLKDFITRRSSTHGGSKEWCFEDIYNVW